MAFEGNLGHIGYLTLSTANDARRSSITGTTLNGPNGSGQFYWVYMSTANDLQVSLGSSLFTPSTLSPIVGILQNTPGPGQAADFAFIGVSKAIAGTTTIVRGGQIQASSTAGGYVTPYLQGNGSPLGFALESPGTVGQVFSLALYGFAHGGYST
jgi:hypothetical protein